MAKPVEEHEEIIARQITFEMLPVVRLLIHMAHRIDSGWAWDLEEDRPSWTITVFVLSQAQHLTMTKETAEELWKLLDCCALSREYRDGCAEAFARVIERPSDLGPITKCTHEAPTRKQ